MKQCHEHSSTAELPSRFPRLRAARAALQPWGQALLRVLRATSSSQHPTGHAAVGWGAFSCCPTDLILRFCLSALQIVLPEQLLKRLSRKPALSFSAGAENLRVPLCCVQNILQNPGERCAKVRQAAVLG